MIPEADLDPFLNVEFTKNQIRKQLSLPVSRVKIMVSNWKELSIKEIKLLREIKNWISVLLRLEKVTNQSCDLFTEWKKIVHLLP